MKSAWYKVKHTTIRNFFHNGLLKEGLEGIVEEEQGEVMADSVVKDNVIRGIISATIFEEYVSIDDKALTLDAMR